MPCGQSSTVEEEGRVVLGVMEAQPPPAKKPCPAVDAATCDASPEEASEGLPPAEGGSTAGGVASSPGGPGEAEPVESEGLKEDTTPAKFGKRRKFAVLLSYSGSGYNGMQKNPGVRTIEDDLLSAMCKAKAFPENMENDLAKLQFQRCARTDKGVSAARQLVSIKMVELENSVSLINAHLPPQIRVMAVKRVTRSFDSRHACVGRMYEYLMPTYAFAPYHQTTPQYRIPESTVELVNELLGLYVGTHNYHNFTSGKKFTDMSSNRYITSFQTGTKFVGGSTKTTAEKELEFISLKVKGQSFVLHQIRKMIGYVIAVVRGRLERAEFEKAFGKEKVDIPKAPALGLLLDNVYFDRYNAKFCNSGERERLEWDDLDTHITEFKKQYIYRTIIDTEIEEMSMMQWLHTLQIHNFHETAGRLKNAESISTTPVTSEGHSAEAISSSGGSEGGPLGTGSLSSPVVAQNTETDSKSEALQDDSGDTDHPPDTANSLDMAENRESQQ